MRDPSLSRLEDEITRIPGVTGVRIVGEESPSEIHVVATGERPAKQVARDVVSLSAAKFDLEVDHRIVSVVQLDAGAPQDGQPGASRGRPVIDRIVLSSGKGADGVKVMLRWPDGSTSEGMSASEPNRKARARAGAAAIVDAVRAVLDGKGARVELQNITVSSTAPYTSVHVHLLYYGNGHPVPLVGSALLWDDAANASARAVLHALNRKLS